MFHSARIKLTAWYLVIIMLISIFFSAFIYLGSTREFDRILRVQEYRAEHPDTQLRIIQRAPWESDVISLSPPPDPQVIAQARLRVLESLVGVNLIIFIISALAGYFLAGRTLRPIRNMIDEQNRFITDASHELNTPLTSLKTSIEVNLRNKNITPVELKEALLSNLEEVDSLQALSDELIKITQYQKPNGNFQPTNINISEAVKSGVQKVAPLAKKKQIKIETDMENVEILGDYRSLVELFTILLDNAIKYSSEKKRVEVNAFKTDSKVKIIVKDQGIGIDKKDLPNIFDRFYRADKSRTKQKVVGYGLGLSIAKRIVVLHQGTIDVESRVSKGTTFTIYFPVI